jgi:ubiquinone biosynthesis protein COQ4
MLALAGPMVQCEFDVFAGNPVGQRLLAEEPRRDLNAVLADRPTLSAMPKGSFADAYLDYMGAEGMGSASYFLDAAGLEEKARQLGWTADQYWFVRRMANSHDLFHVMTGYDRSILGEVGVDAFTAGHIPMLPLRLFLGYLLLLKPSAPFEWSGYVLRCYRQGRATPPLSCLDWESIFPLPIDEARRRAGVCNLAEIHPNGFPASGRKLVRLENKLQGK